MHIPNSNMFMELLFSVGNNEPHTVQICRYITEKTMNTLLFITVYTS